MVASHNSRSLPASRRCSGPMYGLPTPIKCCYPYTPASPTSMDTSQQPEHLTCPQPPDAMAQARKPLLQTSSPVTRSLPENPMSDLALALPSLDYLTKALYAHAVASSQDRAAPTWRHGHRSERRGGVGKDRRSPSRDRRERRTASCERRASITLQHSRREARHVSIKVSTDVPATHTHPQSAITFETTSPQRKLHYVPATPSRPVYSPQRSTFELKHSPPVRTSYPTPPSSVPSSSPKQQPSSPTKNDCVESTPKLLLSPPTPPPTDTAAADAALSKFRRFVLACRETPADETRIDDLIESYDKILGSLVDEVVMDYAQGSD